ncbi:hypothetical protein U6G28_02180 [Actinomycetaceae bacterium MB13-C1-2]|nr:hypothetical protein U6G28_02180 [Actinomycetaceae bacterium MB13-C1-2]
MPELLQVLYAKGTREGYDKLKRLEALSDESPELYPHLDEFISMLDSEKYVIRVRGFRLICRQARWDTDNRINRSIERVLDFLDDEKPTAVRMGLAALHHLIDFKPELHEILKERIQDLDPDRYKDSVSPLITKDAQKLLDAIAELS